VLLTVPLARVDRASPRSRLLSIDITGHHSRILPARRSDGAAWCCASSSVFHCLLTRAAAETNMIELLIAMEGGSENLGGQSPARWSTWRDRSARSPFPRTIAQSRLLFVAGGTGIAPVRAMLDHALRVHPSSKISLLYSTREATSSRSSMNCVSRIRGSTGAATDGDAR
jgi:hypothetical protein